MDETPVEQLHSRIFNALQHAGKDANPAMICALLRHPEVVRLLEQPEFESFFHSWWPKKVWGTIFRPILAHNERVPGTEAERYGLMYSYAVQQLHPHQPYEQEKHPRRESVRKDKCQAKAREPSATERCVASWFKAHFEAGGTFSVPALLFDVARGGPQVL